MPITAQQRLAAEQAQHAAARDPGHKIRLVAGPGTGKSYSIEERVRWLLANGVLPASLFVVSFTRASARDLRARIENYCTANGYPAGAQVSVTTLHSLALRVLRSAGLLGGYPADPMVMDHWELKRIFDAEFARHAGFAPGRCEKIRRYHEAFWSTGAWAPATYIAPSPPITAGEQARFQQFHIPRSQVYAAVLPGEIVRQCVSAYDAGIMNPVELVGMSHLVVDEFQDLNPCDQEFIDGLIQRGVITFIAGDDDQSIYSFRYASPSGIQDFTTRYVGSTAHLLSDCFRCTPSVVAA